MKLTMKGTELDDDHKFMENARLTLELIVHFSSAEDSNDNPSSSPLPSLPAAEPSGTSAPESSEPQQPQQDQSQPADDDAEQTEFHSPSSVAAAVAADSDRSNDENPGSDPLSNPLVIVPKTHVVVEVHHRNHALQLYDDTYKFVVPRGSKVSDLKDALIIRRFTGSEPN